MCPLLSLVTAAALKCFIPRILYVYGVIIMRGRLFFFRSTVWKFLDSDVSVSRNDLGPISSTKTLLSRYRRPIEDDPTDIYLRIFKGNIPVYIYWALLKFLENSNIILGCTYINKYNITLHGSRRS